MAQESRRRYDTTKERLILTGMIVSDTVLSSVSVMYQEGVFSAQMSDTVAKWCLEHFEEYGKAPGRDIQHIFAARLPLIDEEEAKLIERFLARISSEYERGDKVNAPYILDTARKHFKANTLKDLAGDILACLEDGDVDAAEAAMAEHKEVELPLGNAVNPYTNEEAIRAAFEVAETPLFEFDGPLGYMVNRTLVRGGFLSFLGREKVGKTWMLDLFAHRAAAHRCNVAFFSVGDMSQEDMIVRKHVSLSRHPTDPDWIGVDFNRPFAIETTEDEEDEGNFGCRGYRVMYDTTRFDEPLTATEAVRQGRKFGRRLRGRDYKLFTFPNDTVNVAYLRSQLDIVERLEGWVPDVIVIDYADILAPEMAGAAEYRHQQNKTWKALRAFAQERHCLLITATQADAASYDSPVLTMKNFSEDKRKLSHVTGMIGLNQTELEKEMGVMRLNWIVARTRFTLNLRFCHLLQCLPTGEALIASYSLPPRTVVQRNDDGED